MSRFGVWQDADSAANEDHLFGIPVLLLSEGF